MCFCGYPDYSIYQVFKPSKQSKKGGDEIREASDYEKDMALYKSLSERPFFQIKPLKQSKD